MVKQTVMDALNQQVTEELASAYLYLAIAADFEAKNLDGFASWMKIQAKEEYEHAMKIYDYVYQVGGRIEFKSLSVPQTEWASPLDAFQAAYQHECKISGLIHNLVALADKENDYATKSFLNWFVDEQVEEEASVDKIVQRLKMIGDHPQGLLMLDHQLGERN